MSRAVLWSVASVVALTAVAIVIGFAWLPSAHPDFTAKGLWDTICRAAGVPESWGSGTVRPAVRSTSVVLDASMMSPGSTDAAGRGASLALAQCTMCHGPQGMTQSNAPNLAGQYAESAERLCAAAGQHLRDRVSVHLRRQVLCPGRQVPIEFIDIDLMNLAGEPGTAAARGGAGFIDRTRQEGRNDRQ